MFQEWKSETGINWDLSVDPRVKDSSVPRMESVTISG